MKTTDWLGDPFAFKDNKLYLSRKVANRLLRDAQEAVPYEFSALLAGRDATITDAFPMPISPDTGSFSWDGPAFLQALHSIRKRQLQWLGVLHTHPHTAPIPSRQDVLGWHYPTLSYWIVSLASETPEWRVYQWKNGAFLLRDYTVTEAADEAANSSAAVSPSSPKNS